MTIARGQPLRGLGSPRAGGARPSESTFPASPPWVPPMDLLEKPDCYLLRADVPGIKRDDLALQVEDDVLTISGARTRDIDRDAAYHHAERPRGTFSRAIRLPEGVAADGVTATCADGVLEIHIPKPEPARRRRGAVAVADRVGASAA